MFLVKQLATFVNTRPLSILLILTLLFAVFFGTAVIIKYHFFLYNGLDLAIFNNSLWNLVQGHNLSNAIHPPSYWADHFSPWLLIIALPYALWPDPQFLLIWQVIVLAATVWPLYLLASKYLSRRTSCLVAALWLLNPLIHNISLYEFSLVPWSMFFLLWTYYWYDRKHYGRFIIFSLLAITTREDIAVILLGFSLLAAIDRRPWKWWLTPAVMGIGWSALAQYIISQVSLNGGSKFIYFYSWLWQPSLSEISRHIFNLGNVQIFLGLLFPLLFLPLLKPKTLILSLIPLAILRLGSGDDGAPVLRAHYGGLLLWTLFIALIMALAATNPPRLLQRLKNYRPLVILSLVAASLYASLTYGIIIPLINYNWDSQRASDYQLALEQIPPTARVAATYGFLTPLSSRLQIQLLPYAYAGIGQFALTDYALDPQTEYLVIDWQDWLLAQIHYPSRYAQKVSLDAMTSRWQDWQADYQPVWQRGSLAVLRARANAKVLATARPISDQSPQLKINRDDNQLSIELVSLATSSPQALQVQTDASSYYLPLAYGLWTASSSAGAITMPLYDSRIKNHGRIYRFDRRANIPIQRKI